MELLYPQRCASSRTLLALFSSSLRSAAHAEQDSHGKNVVMPRKNAAAVELGRKGGKATAQKLTLEERIESARRAAQARWAKRKEEKPEARLRPLFCRLILTRNDGSKDRGQRLCYGLHFDAEHTTRTARTIVVSSARPLIVKSVDHR